ncbi:glycerol-3-phosphate acyltransferase [Shouchella sp. JSM 1781072]|uniref:glycerol-3-phosphate acyltransferase n=1 Tax=Shouchella sp. JSM 1781072 TaxID=3344581 RepID=UPI0035C23696
MILFLYFFVAYAFGCLNGAYYIGKLFFKQDIRALGSKNAGARNIGRLFGRIAFLSVIAIDTLKTIVPLLFAIHILGLDNLALYFIAIGIMIGHLYPVQLNGHGGKGIVVYLACVLVFSPTLLLIVGVLIGISKLCGIKTTSSAPIAFILLPFLFLYKSTIDYAFLFFILTGIILFVYKKERT